MRSFLYYEFKIICTIILKITTLWRLAQKLVMVAEGGGVMQNFKISIKERPEGGNTVHVV
jgi:hypothetical protein